MEDKIKGIALLLFGILLSCAQDGLNDTILSACQIFRLPLSDCALASLGSALCLANQRTNNCHFVPGQPAACSLACSCYNGCIQTCLPYRQLN